MEEDSTKLHSIFEAFVKVKNEILGIQIQDSLDDDKMEVEEFCVCEQTKIVIIRDVNYNSVD